MTDPAAAAFAWTSSPLLDPWRPSDVAPYGEEAPLIDLDALRTWILHEDEHILAVNKPGWVVCHPSKNGPRSSLVGACRELLGVETLHLVARLDRETSGVVLMAKHKGAARLYQMAFQERAVHKRYRALLTGELREAQTVQRRLAKDLDSAVHVKVTVRSSNSAVSALTEFHPIESDGAYTLCDVVPITGRKHQICAHAAFLGHAVAGDKLYGPDEQLYLEFIAKGWTDHLARRLPLPRQALHAAELRVTLRPKSGEPVEMVFAAELGR